MKNTFILGIAPSLLIRRSNFDIDAFMAALKAIHLKRVIHLLVLDTCLDLVA